MVPQYQWGGNALRNTGLIVGRDCLDVPQDQYRTPILPPDPFPIPNPRPSANVTPVPAALGQPLPTSPENQGFTVYTVGIVVIVPATTFPPPPLPPPEPPSTAQLDFSKPENSGYIPLI